MNDEQRAHEQALSDREFTEQVYADIRACENGRAFASSVDRIVELYCWVPQALEGWPRAVYNMIHANLECQRLRAQVEKLEKENRRLSEEIGRRILAERGSKPQGG